MKLDAVLGLGCGILNKGKKKKKKVMENTCKQSYTKQMGKCEKSVNAGMNIVFSTTDSLNYCSVPIN